MPSFDSRPAVTRPLVATAFARLLGVLAALPACLTTWRCSGSRTCCTSVRDTRYLNDAWIRPTAYRDGRVDVEVITKDVWTLNPGLSFGRKGGRNTSGFEIEELNLLGRGSQLSLGRRSATCCTSTSPSR